jgi:hypothetical protein
VVQDIYRHERWYVQHIRFLPQTSAFIFQWPCIISPTAMHSYCNLAKVSLVPIWHLPPRLASTCLAWCLERHLFAFEVLVSQLGASLNEKSVTRGDVLTGKSRPRQSL